MGLRALVCAALVLTGCGRIGFGSAEVTGVADASVPVPDAPLGPTVQSVFGEGPGADIADVTVDTSIIEGQPTTNCGLCNRINSGPTEVGLLRFDLSSIEAGTVVVGASIEVWLNSLHTLGGSVDVHVVLEAWDEGAQTSQAAGVANWTERQAGVLWDGEGASGSSRELEPFLVGQPASLEEPFVIDIPLETAQAWIDSFERNHGIAFVGHDYPGGGGDHPHYVSREGAADRRPSLTLRFIDDP